MKKITSAKFRLVLPKRLIYLKRNAIPPYRSSHLVNFVPQFGFFVNFFLIYFIICSGLIVSKLVQGSPYA